MWRKGGFGELGQARTRNLLQRSVRQVRTLRPYHFTRSNYRAPSGNEANRGLAHQRPGQSPHGNVKEIACAGVGAGAPGGERIPTRQTQTSLKSCANTGSEMIYLRARNRVPSFELGRLS